MSTYSVGKTFEPESRFKAAHWSILLPVAAFFFVVSRVWNVLPSVMQDEYVYSSQSRFTSLAEQLYPNYLFSALYNSTSLCGNDFYSCAKSLNAGFFVVFLIFFWLIAARLFGIWIASFATTIAVLSPIHVYVSYFMPEMMYFAFLAASIWLILKVGQSSKWAKWLIVGAGFGLTSLVKPHAIFLIPSVVFFALLVVSRGTSLKQGFAAAGSATASFLAIKFGLGFLFAGVNGLTLFGSSYTNSFDSFVNDVSMGGPGLTPAQDLALGSHGLIAAEDAKPSALSVFWGTSLDQILLHTSLVVFVGGIAVAVAVGVVASMILKRLGELEETTSFVILMALMAISMAVVVALFEGLVTTLGDDHTDRIITRYYEFLFPFFVLLAFALTKLASTKIWVRSIQFAIVLALSVVVLVRMPEGIGTDFADSSLLKGLLIAPGVVVFLFVVVVLGALIWLFSAKAGAQIAAWAVTPILLVTTGLVAQSDLISTIGYQKAYFDVAGQQVRDQFRDVTGTKFVVVGQTRAEVFTAMFWINKPELREVVLGSQTEFDLSSVKDADYVLSLGQVKLQGAGEVVNSGDGFQLVKVR